MNRAVINKQINSLILTSISDLTQKALKLLLREAVLFDGEREELVTLTDSSAYCLTWLVTRAIFYLYVLTLERPGTHLETTSNEDTLISKD